MKLSSVARRQDGVVTAAQARTAGMSASAIRWQVLRGAWQILRPGVYLTHSGPVGDREVARSVLLSAGEGAALSHESALWVWQVGPAPQKWTVLIPHSRRAKVAAAETLRTRAMGQVRSVNGFTTTSLDRAIIDVAQRPDAQLDDLIALMARACQKQRTTPERIAAELNSRRAHRLRRPLGLILGDVSEGIESLAEHRFLHGVVRAHRLPAFAMQVGTAQGRADFDNEQFRVRAEVDGLAFHVAGFQSDRRRDRKASAEGVVTARATWWDVDSDPCDLAGDLAGILRGRGWTGMPVSCSPGCSLRVAG